jgi:RNA polymerase sigma-70 factor (ECF subfamily)
MDVPPDTHRVRPFEDLSDLRRVLERAVRRICRSSLASHHEDIVQQAMIRVTQTFASGEEKEPRTGSYLWKVAYTAALKEIQRVRRRREVGIEDAGGGMLTDGRAPDPERASFSREIGVKIRECLDLMVEPRRLAVLLHLHGYGLGESATVLGWPAKRCDNLLYRGLSDLRKCLESKGVKP